MVGWQWSCDWQQEAMHWPISIELEWLVVVCKGHIILYIQPLEAWWRWRHDVGGASQTGDTGRLGVMMIIMCLRSYSCLWPALDLCWQGLCRTNKCHLVQVGESWAQMWNVMSVFQDTPQTRTQTHISLCETEKKYIHVTRHSFISTSCLCKFKRRMGMKIHEE